MIGKKIGVAGAALLALAYPAFAADETQDSASQIDYSTAAVSEVNGKLAIGYAYFDFNDIVLPPIFGPQPNDDQDGIFVEGSISVPLGQQFGFQLDGAYADLSNDVDLAMTAIGAHLFWRDPSTALLGAYAEYKEFGDLIETYMFAVEGELYKDQFSFEWFAGLENLETPFGDSDFFAGEAVAAYYPTDNARIYGGIRRRIETTSFVVGGEFMSDTGGTSPSIFVDASFGGDDTSSISGGIRLYFGSNSKSLIRRHREDDPINRLKQGTDAVGTCVNNADSSMFPIMGLRGGMPTFAPDTVRLDNAVVPMFANPTFEDCTLTSPMRGYVPYGYPRG